MKLVQWNQDFSVNVVKIDEEHKQLLTLVNDLHDAMRSGKGRLIVGKVLEDLVLYTQTHFHNEEQLMAQANYPGLPGHKLIHAELINQVNELVKKNEAGILSLSMEVMGFLKNWLVNHIQGVDKAYSEHLNKNGIS